MYSSLASSLRPTGGIWEHLPASKMFGCLCPQVSRLLSSSVPGRANSSDILISWVSSSTSYIPFGHISVAWVILANWHLRRCLSFPGNGGQLSIEAFKSPVKICFICLETSIWRGSASGSYIQSLRRFSVTQNTWVLAPSPLFSIIGFFDFSSSPTMVPWAIQ